MPPEPISWDRKEVLKERKHSSSESSKWRDNNHHGSSVDFRRPSSSSGHGKQGGGWHVFSEDSSGGEGKYGRRENRAGFSGQKESKGHSWESTASPNGSAQSEFVNSWDQGCPKEQEDKNGGVSNTVGQRVERGKEQEDKNGGVSNIGQRVERVNSPGSIDWKPLKWTRSGSLTSRGSCFSHSSSSKRLGADAVLNKTDAQLNNGTPVQSPSGDANGCIAFGTSAEDNSSRKKPRLGWGEGLAKYEKKKVDGPDEAAQKETASMDSSAKDAMTDNDSACNSENLHSNLPNVMEKSPSFTGFSECASPATPSSVACSSSQGSEEKSCPKTSPLHNGACNPSSSSSPVSMDQPEGLTFNLENLEPTQLTNFSSSLRELLQSDEPSLLDSGFVRSTALNKLSLWKADISKILEVTESEIDLLENELKFLVSDSEGVNPCPPASTSLSAKSKVKSSEELCAASNVVSRPSPLTVSSGDIFMETVQDKCGEVCAEVKDEDIDSPGSATSKFVEPLSLRKDVLVSGASRQSDCLMDVESRSENLEVKHSVSDVTEGIAGVVPVGGGPQLTACTVSGTPSVVAMDDRENTAREMILALNRESANAASQIFSKVLPKNEMSSHITRTTSVPCPQNELQIKGNFLMKKRSLRFRERATILKFRALQHLWKEDLRLLSIRRSRAKAQKKSDLSSRFVYNSYQKHRSSIRSRFPFPDGNLSLVPTSEIISYANKLLSDPQVKIYRDTLTMPSLILDKKERIVSRFISDNRLVEDPCAVEKERAMVNPWTPQETDIYLDKLATFGKDFQKIASFLDHKTTADCVDFYYKNHKSESFQKIKKKKSELTRQEKIYSTNTYMVTSGKRWNHETNAASLDMLGAVSEIAANADDCLEKKKCTSRLLIGASRECKKPRGDDGIIPEKASNVDVFGNERETTAADVLAGICGSMSSEAMSSCITSSIDPGDSHPQDLKCQKVIVSSKRLIETPEVTQSVIDDETCSDESCGEEMDTSDWTDKEKSLFIQAVASYGKDFAMISRHMKTRSRNQCKVFFSKARKCLGLDMIHPEPCSMGTAGGNGGGIDGEDACCMVERGLAICEPTVSSGCKTDDQDMQLSDLKVERSDSAHADDMNLQPDLKELEDKKDVLVRSEDLVPNDSKVDDKPEINSVTNSEDLVPNDKVSEVHGATDNAKLNKARESQDTGHAISEEVVSVEEIKDHSLPSTLGAEVEKEANGKVSAEGNKGTLLRDKLLLPPEASMTSTISGVDAQTFCPAGDLDSAHHSSGDRNSSMELDTAQKPPVFSLDRDNCSQASNSYPQDTIAVHHRKALSHDDTSSSLDFLKGSGSRSQRSASTDGYYHQHLPNHSLLDCVESSQILKGYPITLSNKNGINGDVCCNEPSSSLQSVSNLERNNHHYLSRDVFLQKCNSTTHNGLMSEIPFLSREQKQSSSSEVEKPCKSGNVKLFGQILSNPSSQQSKPSCSSTTHENEDKGGHHSKPNMGKSFNLKFGDNQSIDKNSFLPKYEENNYLSAENNNHPLRSYGFWDGSRIQTGLSSLPDSAILLAKYPAAFGNSPTLTSKIDPQPPHSAINNNERGLNGLSVFPTRELSSSSSKYRMYASREAPKLVQPFTVDQLRQDFLTQVQRRKELELMSSSIHQQGRRGGMVGLNMGGGVREGGGLIGGFFNGVSDPVAAMKMHYAKTEQYRGSIREDESWRSSSR